MSISQAQRGGAMPRNLTLRTTKTLKHLPLSTICGEIYYSVDRGDLSRSRICARDVTMSNDAPMKILIRPPNAEYRVV